MPRAFSGPCTFMSQKPCSIQQILDPGFCPHRQGSEAIVSSHASAPARACACAYDRAATIESLSRARQGAVVLRFDASRVHAVNALYGAPGSPSMRLWRKARHDLLIASPLVRSTAAASLGPPTVRRSDTAAIHGTSMGG
jgi:hypothetical protein